MHPTTRQWNRNYDRIGRGSPRERLFAGRTRRLRCARMRRGDQRLRKLPVRKSAQALCCISCRVSLQYVPFGGEFQVSVKIDYGVKMSTTSLAEVLGMAEKIAVEHVHGSIIVAFDEFQEINSALCDFGQCRVNFVSKMCVRPLISCQKCATLCGERHIIGEKRRRN